MAVLDIRQIPKVPKATEPDSPERAVNLRIRELMAGYRVSHEALAQAIGMPRGLVGDRLAGGRKGWTLNEIMTIERAFDLEPGTLLREASDWMVRHEGLEPPTR